MHVTEINLTLKDGKPVVVQQVNNDACGNPRYVIHYLNIASNYSDALDIAKQKVRGKKYAAKWYGGGVVFSTYNLEHTLETLFNS